MKRAPPSEEELIYLGRTREFLYDLLGDPDRETGDDIYYGNVAINVGGGEKHGLFFVFAKWEGGRGVDVLPLLDLSKSDLVEWIKKLSPTERAAAMAARPSADFQKETERRERETFDAFQIFCDAAGPDDGRIVTYLKGRGIPSDVIADAGLQLGRSLRKRFGKGGALELSHQGMIAWATTEDGEKLAGQILTLTPQGVAYLVEGPIDKATGKPQPRKERRTWRSKRGWYREAAWRLPAKPAYEADPTVIVEGVEDALSVRVAGWKGAVVATLGKAGFKIFAPNCKEVILLPDRDVSDDEITDYIDFHIAAGRKVRVARLPELELDPEAKDPNDFLVRGHAGELMKAIVTAPERESPWAALLRDVRAFELNSRGEMLFDQAKESIAKRHGVSKTTVQRERKRLWEEKKRADKAAKEKPSADASSGRNVIDVWPDPVLDGLAACNEMLEFFQLHVKTKEPARLAVLILWAMHATEFKRWPYTPRLYIHSPAQASGKTKAGTLTQQMIPDSQLFTYTSGAGLLRLISQLTQANVMFVPCIDEVDGLFDGENAEDLRLRNVWNANETVRKQTVLMAEQTDRRKKFDPTMFEILAPMMAIGIDDLPGTMKSRTIIIRIFRSTERPPAFDAERQRTLASRLLRWVNDNADKFEFSPEMPDVGRTIDPRERDDWTPIVSIARTIGGNWPDMVREAMRNTFAVRPAFNRNLNLLLDIRRVFDQRRERKHKFPDMIRTSDLANDLFDQAYGMSLFAGVSSADTARERRLADRLEDWEIRPRRTIVQGYPGADKRGRVRIYERWQFEAHWTSYGIDDLIRAETADDDPDPSPGLGPGSDPGAGAGPSSGPAEPPRDSPASTPGDIYKGHTERDENAEEFSPESSAPVSPNIMSPGVNAGELRGSPPHDRIPWLRDVKSIHRLPAKWAFVVEADDYGDLIWQGGAVQPPGWREELGAYVAQIRRLLDAGMAPAGIGEAMRDLLAKADDLTIPPFLKRPIKPNGSGETP